MTEPVWVPAHPPSPALSWPHPPPGRSCGSCPLSSRLPARTPSSDMSPSGRLYLLTIVGLILTTRGQTLEEATSISLAGTTTVNIHAVTQTPDTVHPELQTSTLQASVEVTASQMETQTQHLTGVDVLLTTAPGTEGNGSYHLLARASQDSPSFRSESLLGTCKVPGKATFPADPTKGTTPSKQSPDQDFMTDPVLSTTGSSEDDPFSYDEVTLRKQGLLVAAVLFITGIVILTSGKCRQLPRLCRNHNR
ncbi:LOW QUALITY PROTEIN: FXYD domain-containing ion transport regulator 5 [Desmodus rotundus]|uniref:LOW QUALITY PROTEIN: FXYD domain-containing ion transport regulator 5 n=1 Tax=Desmodus rotundus TaxID=9430 RepID=UPI002380D6B0|nr:LOW QUALITY PROTEIN: FXYD domain-containing ion transport regulator 5 [Desmodus rotundus]